MIYSSKEEERRVHAALRAKKAKRLLREVLADQLNLYGSGTLNSTFGSLGTHKRGPIRKTILKND